MPDRDTAPTDPAPPPVHWHEYKLRKLNVAAAIIAGKYCRVSELGEGFVAVEVEGLEPIWNEEPPDVCRTIAELSALGGKMVRRCVAADGVESYR